MVFVAMKQCFLWSRAFHLNLEEVLDEFYQLKLPKYALHSMIYAYRI